MLPRIEPVIAPGGGGAGAGAHGGRGDRSAACWGGASTPRWPSSRSTACGPTARAPRRRASTGRRWRARGEMLERRLVAELDSAPLVVLDPSAPASEEALDMAVRAAASLCVHLAHAGGCAVLLPGDRRPIEIGHDLRRLAGRARAAGAGGGRRRPPPASTLGPRGGAVIWVTGADLAAPRAPSSACRPARASSSRRAPLPGVRALFEVAGCTGCLVGARARAGGGRRERGARPAGRRPPPAALPRRRGGAAARASAPRRAAALRLAAFAALAPVRRRPLGRAGRRAPAGRTLLVGRWSATAGGALLLARCWRGSPACRRAARCRRAIVAARCRRRRHARARPGRGRPAGCGCSRPATGTSWPTASTAAWRACRASSGPTTAPRSGSA